jgi:hypothetical protein
MFTPRLETLPPPQFRLWSELNAVPAGFVLYGGTALALRLGHRTSEDFDFFSNQSFQPDDLERQVSFLGGALRLQSSPNTLTAMVERGGRVKVSFFGGLSLRRVHDPEPAEGPGVLVASLLDLAATKVKVVQDRAETKDYIDIARFLEEGVGLAHALGAALAVYGNTFNPLLSLKALSYFADGDLSSLSEAIRTRLTGAVREIDPRHLPAITPQPDGVTSD